MSNNEQMTIAEFLEARIAEDEIEARDLQQETDFGLEAFGDYMLAECAAKRAIIASCVQMNEEAKRSGATNTGIIARGMVGGLMSAIYSLAAVYSSHPDYQQEWAL